MSVALVEPHQDRAAAPVSEAPADTGRLKLLILNGDLPVFPGWGGHEYLHTTRLARLARRVGLVSMAHTREQSEKTRGLADAGVELYLWENPHLPAGHELVTARPRLMRRVGEAFYNFARNWPPRPQDTLVQDLQFRNMSAPLLRAVNDERWQVLIVVQSKCARWLDYVPPFPVSVLVLHDVRALVYERQARTATSLWNRLMWQREARRYRRFEREYCRKFDLVITVSSADEEWVRRHYQPARSLTVPIPVDSEYFAPMPGIPERKARIVFTGMMAHPPNVDAACFFAEEVLPRIQQRIPQAEFWIVGREPSPRVRALAGLPGVVVTGFVTDMRPFVAQATVVVVPLRFGSGMRQKILEAWAMGKCVISTRVGAEGLDYEDGVNLLLADGADSLAERVVQSIEEPARRDRIRTQGRTLVATRHHPERLARAYYEAIASTLDARRARQAPMRVAIDLRWMRPGLAGGIENLSRSFLDHLLQLDGFNRYTVLLPSESRYDFDLRQHPNVRPLVADGPGRHLRALLWRGARLLHARFHSGYWRTPDVAALDVARRVDADLALSIPGYIHPEVWPLTNVLVAPDIQHEYFPEFFSAGELEERRRLYTRSARHAAHICAISEFTRQTLIERLDIPAERITTTHLAADPMFHPGSPVRRASRAVLDKYGLKAGGYLLFPGNTWRHKNHVGALRALDVLRETYGLDPLLVCTGGQREASADVFAAMHSLRLEGRVRFLGYCPSADMPGLYEGAAALVFPSLFEGFGIPLLEAMWCDCPVVCSDTTSLPEIAGDAALLIDPTSPEALAHALSRVLTDVKLRRSLVERGRRRVTRFSWAKFTAEIIRVLLQVDEQRYE